MKRLLLILACLLVLVGCQSGDARACDFGFGAPVGFNAFGGYGVQSFGAVGFGQPVILARPRAAFFGRPVLLNRGFVPARRFVRPGFGFGGPVFAPGFGFGRGVSIGIGF